MTERKLSNYLLTEQQRNLVMAALRYWQRAGEFAGQDLRDIATNSDAHEEIDNDEIDALCESLNCDGVGQRSIDNILLEASLRREDELRKRFDPIEAPIDEARARELLSGKFFGDRIFGTALIVDTLIEHRSEVVMILQGIGEV